MYRFGSENPSVIDERFSSCMICSHFLFCLQEIIPKRFHQKLFSMLIPVLEDPEPRSVSSSLLIKLNICSSCFRVHPHAASALINFCEGNERDTLLPYLNPSVCKSGLKTAKRPQPDRTKTGKDRTSSPVF